jgi:hypothetical protein
VRAVVRACPRTGARSPERCRRSADGTQRVVGENGGVVEKPAEAGQPVLSHEDVRMPCDAAQRVREVFAAEGVQDIEWVITEPLEGRRP